ncbi:uncharacterized protein LOC126901808 isoform X3 [Daktulosphaira vitifoliae]|uniref:uncharacterized protein LOC126901808 isoform X3 n=1 Tax=Daktulosphaira vitifoliae TaxID=58002 RepID=UPI0021AA7042|nr:uncharacterized protein LOC126901808 isoform X3 [Daktulosphaira vitifoliae]
MTLFYCILFIIAVNGMNEKLFQGINKQSYQEEITLESLIPQELISLNTHLSKIKPKECNNIGSCMKYIDNTTDEMIHGIASEVHKTFSSTMQKYTQLAYLIIISSITDDKDVNMTNWVNLLSLKSHNGHRLLEYIYRTNIQYDSTLFKIYLFFSDLENIFTASVDKPYTNEKLLQLIEDKTNIPRPSDKNGVYEELLHNIYQMQTKISQLSDRFCSITNSWFHPHNLKFKKVIYNAGKPLIERIDNNYTHLEHKQVFSKCNKSKWYDCIRSENDMEVLFQFSNLVIKSMIQEVGHSAVVYLDVYSYALNDLKKKISNGLDVNESINQHTSTNLRIIINQYLNDIQKIKNLIFDKHGIKVDLNNDLCEKIKYIYNELYIKLENILDQKYVLNIIKELRIKIQKYREIISENINYKYGISEMLDQFNWNNLTNCLYGHMCFTTQSILKLLA